MPELIEKNKILAGREAVDAYRTAHTKLCEKGWYKGMSEDHTPLLEKLVVDLEKIGITSVLKKLWADSDLLNLQEFGFTDWEDFEANATDVDRETLRLKWS